MLEKGSFDLKVTEIKKVCAAGEKFGQECQRERKIPVFSCEGGCIKGEIARQAANILARQKGYARGCHGELFTVPHADLSKWIKEAERVVVIDGCGLLCHSRIAEHIIGNDTLVVFDALSIHGKYAHLMSVDDVTEKERIATASKVAEVALARLNGDVPCCDDATSSCDCGENEGSAVACCG